MQDQDFTYRPRPVVDFRQRDKVRKMMQAAKKAGQKEHAPIPEKMKGKVVRRSSGYSVRVYVTSIPFHGPVCKTPELAYEYYWSYFERAKHLHELCVSNGISAKALSGASIGRALRG